MKNGIRLPRLFKWAGIAALVALPIVILIKKKQSDRQIPSVPGDDADIFSAELEERAGGLRN